MKIDKTTVFKKANEGLIIKSVMKGTESIESETLKRVVYGMNWKGKLMFNLRKHIFYPF